MSTPRFGFKLPNCGGIVCRPEWADPATILDLASRAHSQGYDSLWLHEHLLMPAELKHIADAHLYDPLTVMSQVLAHLPDIEVGTAAIVLPLNEPVSLAKRMMTLQSFHPGRAIFGVGAGQYESEFAAFGSDFYSRRGRVMGEYLALLEALLTRGTVDFEGEFRTLRNAFFHPTVDQVGRPPVWVAGNAAPAIKRAARLGHGWISVAKPIDELRESVALVRALVAESDAPDRPFPVAMSTTVKREATGRVGREGGLHEHVRNVSGDAESVAAQLREYADIGVDHFLLTFGAEDLNQVHEDVEWFASEVRPLLAGAHV